MRSNVDGKKKLKNNGLTDERNLYVASHFMSTSNEPFQLGM